MTLGDPGTYTWLTRIWLGPDPNDPDDDAFHLVWEVNESPDLDPPDHRQAICHWPGVWLKSWRCGSGLAGGPLDPSTAGVLSCDVTVDDIGKAAAFAEGRTIHIEANAVDSAGGWQGLFTGTIVSAPVTPPGVRGDGRTTVDVTATDLLGYLGRATVGDVPWPAERATVRIDRILQAAVPPPATGRTVDAQWLGPIDAQYAGYAVSGLAEGSMVAARDVDAQPAQTLLELAVGYGAIIVDPHRMPTASQPWGATTGLGGWPLRIAPSPVRPAPILDPPELVERIPCTAIIAGSGWTSDAETLVNTVTVTTGNLVTDDQGQQTRQQVTVRDTASIRSRGPRSRSISTDWADPVDALTAGLIVTGRMGRPRSRLSTLTINPHRIPATDINPVPGRALLSAGIWDGVVEVELPVRPAELRADGTPRWAEHQLMYLDAVTHTVTRQSWHITLGLSHPDDVGPLWSYDPETPTGVPAGDSWATWRPGVPFNQLDAPLGG